MIYTCPFCRALFEMGADHGIEPCARCYHAGCRIDTCGNKYLVLNEDDRASADKEEWDFAHGGIGAARDGTDI